MVVGIDGGAGTEASGVGGPDDGLGLPVAVPGADDDGGAGDNDDNKRRRGR